jgi:hypothetical protein
VHWHRSGAHDPQVMLSCSSPNQQALVLSLREKTSARSMVQPYSALSRAAARRHSLTQDTSLSSTAQHRPCEGSTAQRKCAAGASPPASRTVPNKLLVLGSFDADIMSASAQGDSVRWYSRRFSGCCDNRQSSSARLT